VILESPDRILIFEAAGAALFTHITAVDRVVEEHPVVQLPFSAPGLVGLLEQDQELLPLYDLEALVNQTPARERVLDFALVAVLPTPEGRLGLRLDRLIGLFPPGEPVSEEGEPAVTALPDRIRRSVSGVMRLQGLLSFHFAPDLFAEVILSDMGSAALPQPALRIPPIAP